MSDAAFKAGKRPGLLGRPDQAFNPFRAASKGGPGSGPTPAIRQAFERPVRAIRDNPIATATAGATATAAAGRPARGQVDAKTSAEVDRLLKRNPKPGSSASTTNIRQLMKLYDKLPLAIQEVIVS